MRYLLLLLLGATFLPLVAQQQLSGRVLDATTGAPIAFATVYLDGTSNGMVTEDDGSFRLAGAALPATLVASHLNYAPYTLSVDRATPLILELQPRENELLQATVTSLDARRKNLEEFRRSLLGSDEWGENARIDNEDALMFDRDYREEIMAVRNARMRQLLLKRDHPEARWNADRTEYRFVRPVSLRASSVQPLLIRLPDLGYEVRLDLRAFLSDYGSGTRSYLATFYYQSVDGLRGRHLRNRRRAYLGSPMHFGRALSVDSLTANGFAVMEVIPGPTPAEEPELRPLDLYHYVRPVADNVLAITGMEDCEIAILYYGDDRWRPLPEARWARAEPVVSRCRLLSDRCLLATDGTYLDTNMLFSGYMGDLGLAWLLPSDYVYDQD